MMLALVLGVVVASVLGSLHCAGMCGPFLAFALGLNEPGVSKARAQAAYHAGRLATYTLLGAIAGLLGKALDVSGEALGLQRVTVALAGATMIVFGLTALARASGRQLPSIKAPRYIERVFRRGCDAAMRVPPLHRAAIVGLLTTLLPCGWLYSFAIVAAGTASPASGAIVMGAFWLGTLPVMVSLGAGVQTLAGPLRRAVPTVMALVIIALGLHALVGRAGVSLANLETAAQAAHPGAERVQRSSADAPASRGLDASRAALERIGDEPLPCCEGEEEAAPANGGGA